MAMREFKLYDEEMRDWVEQHCTDYTVTGYAIDHVTFEKVPYSVQFCTEADETFFLLRWS